MKTPKKFEILQRKTLYQGYFSMDKVKLKFEKFEGGMSASIERELFLRHEAVSILLYDPKLDCVVLVQQFRLGLIDQAEQSPWLIECVAGMLHKGDVPEAAAIRETQEETGLNVKKIFSIGNFWVSPGVTNEKVYVFLGIIDAKNADGIHGLSEENEDICIIKMQKQDAFVAIENGVINNIYTVIALQWLKLNQNLLQE